MHSHPKSLAGALIFNQVRRRHCGGLRSPLPLWQGRRRLAAASPRDVKGYSRRVWLVVVGQGVEKIVESTTSMFVKKSTVGPSATAEPVFLFLGWLARELGIPGIKRGVEKLSP